MQGLLAFFLVPSGGPAGHTALRAGVSNLLAYVWLESCFLGPGSMLFKYPPGAPAEGIQPFGLVLV